MITNIKVDGFKSLSNFELKLQQGINILVGPNGSGKTNIVLFFEFISKSIDNTISHSISALGGAGSIFKKIGNEQYSNQLYFEISGSRRVKEKQYINYKYSALIEISFEKDIIRYTNQSFKTFFTNHFIDDLTKINNPKWDIDIDFKSVEEKEELFINEYEFKKFRGGIYSDSSNKRDVKKRISDFLRNSNLHQISLIKGLLPFITSYFSYIISDFTGGESFNIVPSKVKEQEDAASPPGIKKDGSGLATTLYAMETNKSFVKDFFKFNFFEDLHEIEYNKDTLEKIISYLRLANKTVTDLNIINDPFDNRLVIKINIEAKDYSAVLPLSAMSDGTIKWLTLITAILTSKSIYSIEEPENFLHPWMQAEIVNIMRERITNKEYESFVIMTTHSESLLNHSNPNEVLFVTLDCGSTIAKRIENIDILKNEISNTGFGLGHFYFTNVINYE
ncbi:AAA family ATPase [Chryseobacterium gambrini]|uniref:AAA family ATPase n=1 Tax=Chryseobacterium TaxID=59732 RepID=UPI0025B37F84|nr:ATP-binding protein [Chryseobacterium gambrini]MDN4031221.1 AAA family ATPase [Chryseobacterium gambrini]